VRTAEAAELPGVVAVLTAADLPPTAAYLPGTAEPTLVVDEVRYVGQPIAVVLAESAEVAEDAAELVTVEYAPRPPLLVPRDPARPLSAAVFEHADVVLDERFTVPRRTGLPMEPRAVLAAWGEDGLTVWSSTEHPQRNRDALVKALDLAADELRMAPGDVGGTVEDLYPEDITVTYAVTRLRRPVKWIEDRDEHLVSVNHSPEQTWHVRLAATPDGDLLAAEVDVVSDAGAYVRPLETSLGAFPGPYRFGSYHASSTRVRTNKTPTAPASRFEANFVRERALDQLAEHLSMDPTELRRRNLRTDLPHTVAAFDRLVALDGTPTADDGLRRGRAVVPFGHTGPSGALACSVAVDPELLTVQVEELTIVCDAGDETLVIGSVVQGVGAALLEELTYDEAGHPPAPGLDGYLLPLAADVPDVNVLLTHPNPLGADEIGEAGRAAAGAAVAAAVCAAMPELNHALTGLPLSPSRLLDALTSFPTSLATANGFAPRAG
jgi:CO/xanthine dehydrogenase Mo-binding subunit